MAFKGKYPVRTKIFIKNCTLEQVSRFKYLGCAVSCESEYDIREKINKFRNICGTIHRNLRNKTRHSTRTVSYTHLDVYKRQVLIWENEENLQRAMFNLQEVEKEYSLTILVKKMKTIASTGKYPMRTKIVINNSTLDQVSRFKFLGCVVSYESCLLYTSRCV